MEQRRSWMASAEGMPLVALPKDILRIILKKISLRDRLRLELLDKSHRDTLRDTELWQEMDLRAMQALNLKEDQLLSLLGRIVPGLEQVASEIESIAMILRSMTCEFVEQARRPELDSAALIAVRTIAKTCMVWFTEQVRRIWQLPSSCQLLLKVLLQTLLDPTTFIRRVDARMRKHRKSFRQGSRNTTISLDVSGARFLPPHFIGACIISLSAAGFEVNLKMDGDSDPLFPLYHLVGLLRILALGSSVQVNMVVAGLYPRWKKHFLEDYNPESLSNQEQTPEFDLVQALHQYKADFDFIRFEGSEASPRQDLQDKILVLLQHRNVIEAAAGRSHGLRSGSIRPRVVASAVIFQNVALPQTETHEDLRDFLHACPFKLRFVFRDCLLGFSDVRSLCELLGNSGARSVSFQQAGLPYYTLHNSSTIPADVLASAALQKSTDLRSLELDCPFLLDDLDAAASFLAESENFSELVLHIRTVVFAGFDDGVLSAKLRELCASERGARVKIVQHRTPTRLPLRSTAETFASEDNPRDASMPVFYQRFSTVALDENTLRVVDVVVEGYAVVIALLFLAHYLGFKVFTSVLQATYCGLSVGAVRALWPAIRILLEKDSPRWMRRFAWPSIAMSLYTCAVAIGVVSFSPLLNAFKGFWKYMGLCLLWTGARQLFRAVLSFFSCKDKGLERLLKLA